MSKQKFIVTKQNNFRTGTILTGRVEKTLFAGGPCLVVHTSNGVRSIVEILENGAELDLYFTPCTMKEIEAKHA